MGGSGQSAQQAQQSSPVFGALNPAIAGLNQALGLDTRVNAAGLLDLVPGQGVPDILPSGSLEGLFDTLPIDFGGTDIPGLQSIRKRALGVLRDATEDGLSDATVAESRRLFQEEFLPSTTEQLGVSLGLGLGDSDFASIVGREAGRRSSELAALGADRQLQAATAAPGTLADDVGFGEALFNFTKKRSPALQTLGDLKELANLATPSLAGAFSSGGSSSSGTSAQLK